MVRNQGTSSYDSGRQGTFTTFSSRVQSFIQELNLNAFDLAIILTLVLLLLFESQGFAPVAVVVSAAIVFKPLRTSALFWLLVTLLLAAPNAYDWFIHDNHRYLINYWCFALFLACLAKEPDRVLSKNARLLVGLAFFFATLWKLISSDYLNGTFFYFALLEDGRFADVATYLAGVGQEQLAYNSRTLDALRADALPPANVQLQSGARVGIVSVVLTWWTLFIEGVIALAFLWPTGRFIARYRDLLLLVFLFTTYGVATVPGFGSILAVLGIAGLAQHKPNTYATPLYLLAFFMMQIFDMPWRDLLAPLLTRL